MSEKTEPLFKDLNADSDPVITEIESLCMQCQENGTTRLLLTKIPFYKEVVLMSFKCDHCQWENNELQPAAKIQEKGVSFKLNVLRPKDLGRIVVKTEWASITVPELELEIPSKSQEGSVTTVEGIIDRTCTGLSSKLEFLKTDDPSSVSKLADFLSQLLNMKSGDFPFTFILRDITGNSYLENLCVPDEDPQLEITHFERSREENLMLGIYSVENEEAPTEQEEDSNDLKDEVLGLPTNCYACNAPCVTNMKITQIPHFKDVVIICTACDSCGHKTNEVKSNSGIEPLGLKITLLIDEPQDLRRDLIKSDTTSICIKELDLQVGAGAFSGRYTTVEGILEAIKNELKQNNPFISGDSADMAMKQKMESLFTKIDEIVSGTRKATLILDDPCGNCYIQSIHYPDPDTNLTVEKYKRSLEQDEELGLLDMKVENYEES